MGIEAELKARLRDPERVRELLRQRGPEEVNVYSDTYYDRPDRELTREGRELRVRVVQTEDVRRVLLTYKGGAVHADSGSKPETETTAGDAATLDDLLRGLGFTELIAFEKHCANFRFTARDRELVATVAHVPELDDTFIEIETTVDTEEQVEPALDVIRTVLGELGVTPEDETTGAYTEAVAARRDEGTQRPQ